MQKFIQEIQVRWSDIDANVHVRHSAYYDWGASCRVNFLNQQGLNSAVMQRLQIGPILFREECIFRKEVRLEDKVTIDASIVTAKRDFSRWTFRHVIRKNEGVECAILTIEGAWLNIALRKLASPIPEEVIATFSEMPRVPEFEWK